MNSFWACLLGACVGTIIGRVIVHIAGVCIDACAYRLWARL